MEFTIIPCHETLNPFIKNYWMITAHCTARSTQQLLANGNDSLHFYLSQAVCLNDSDQRYRTVLHHQVIKSVGVISEKGPLFILGVEFQPFCSHMFFHTDFKEQPLTPEAMKDAEFILLSQSIHQAQSTEERVDLLDRFFMKRLAECPADDINIERLSNVFNEMMPESSCNARTTSHPFDFTTANLASTACLSQKQFTRIFTKYVGMNPKAYLRLLRFDRALHKLQQLASEMSLNDLAWRCGYYDSSHMSADFREICGFKPSELIKSQNGLTEAFQPVFSGRMRKKIMISNLI